MAVEPESNTVNGKESTATTTQRGLDVRSEGFMRLREAARRQIEAERGIIESLKETRESQGLDLEEVAFRMGITRNRLEMIEAGMVRPGLDEVGRYATSIGVLVEFVVVKPD